MDDKRLVRKLLGSVPEKFMQIVSAIEQFADMNTMPFQEAVGRLKAFEERTKKAVKEEDVYSKLLFTKGDEKEKAKEHKCERCGHENSNQGRPGRGRGKNGKPWKNKDGDQDKSQIRCYQCNELGHYKSECPKLKEKTDEANLIKYEDDVLMVL
jgi:DNA-directed RNA polymerase subunit RPC12/RpoP